MSLHEGINDSTSGKFLVADISNVDFYWYGGRLQPYTFNNLIVPEGVTELSDCTITNGAATIKTSLVLPSTLKTLDMSIMFKSTTNAKVMFNNNTSGLESINAYASHGGYLFTGMDVSDFYFGKSLNSVNQLDKFGSGCSGAVKAYKNTYASSALESATLNPSGKVVYILLDEVMPSSLVLNRESLTLASGDTFQLIGTVYPSSATDKTVSYESSNPLVATVDSNGVVTGVSPGTAQIMAFTVNGLSDSCSVTVGSAPTDITLSFDTVTVSTGGSNQIVATVSPVGAIGEITYESSNPAVATVNSAGLIWGVGAGTAEITVKCGSIEKKISVTVNDTVPVSGIDVADSFEIIVGSSKNLNATAIPAGATDTSLAYIVLTGEDKITGSPDGTITALAVGTATVRIQSVQNPAVSKEVTITVKEPEPVSVKLTADNSPTNQSIAIYITTTGDVDYLVLPSGVIVQSDSFIYNTSVNGVFTVKAVGKDGTSATDTIEITGIDKVGPTIIVNSIINENDTTYSIDAIDKQSGLKEVTLPDASVVTTVPTTYVQDTFGEVTFIAEDNAGNISTKSSERKQLMISGGTTSTFVAYEGIPTSWTNKDATITVAALNPSDKAALVITTPGSENFGSRVLGSVATGLSDEVVAIETVAGANGDLDVRVENGSGGYTNMVLEIKYIDKDAPTATHTLTGGLIHVEATDALSGVDVIITPSGEVVSATSVDYTVTHNGTYRFTIIDVATNVLYYNVVVTGMEDPEEEIVPPPVDGAQEVNAQVVGTVYPVSTVSVVVPTNLSFIIDKDRNFIGSNYTFINNGVLPVLIKVKSVSKQAGTTTDLVAPNSFINWDNLSEAQTRGNLALMLGGISIHAPDTTIMELSADETKILELTGKYGKEWGNTSDLVLQYGMMLEIVQ